MSSSQGIGIDFFDDYKIPLSSLVNPNTHLSNRRIFIFRNKKKPLIQAFKINFSNPNVMLEFIKLYHIPLFPHSPIY